MNRKTYDLVVIGAGSGGIAAAKRARRHGASVALIELSTRFGGTCVNAGCIPKKLMAEAALVGSAVRASAAWGYSQADGSFDLSSFRISRDDYVAMLSDKYERSLLDAGVELFLGYKASLLSASEVQIERSPPIKLSARHILIATGSEPIMPPLEGIEHCISSDGLWELEELPRSLAVVGGGYIGIEASTVFKSLAGPERQVTVLVREPSEFLKGFDSTLRESAANGLRESGITFDDAFGNLKKIERDGATGQLWVHGGGGKDDSGKRAGPFDCVLLALGRKASTQGLNLKEVGIKTEEKGGSIVVNAAHSSVSHPDSIHAVGDVSGKKQLTPLAIAAGRLLADRLFGGFPTATLDYCNVPTVVFCKPPIGTVGLSEGEARARFDTDSVRTFTTTFAPLQNSFAAMAMKSNSASSSGGNLRGSSSGGVAPPPLAPIPLHTTTMKLVCVRMDDEQFARWKAVRVAELRLRLAFAPKARDASAAASSGPGQPAQPQGGSRDECSCLIGDIGAGTADDELGEPDHWPFQSAEVVSADHDGYYDDMERRAGNHSQTHDASRHGAAGDGTGYGAAREGSIRAVDDAYSMLVENSRLRVVGIHIHGDRADEMVQGFAAFLKRGVVTKADLDAVVAIHPTASEELVTMQPWMPLDLAALVNGPQAPTSGAGSTGGLGLKKGIDKRAVESSGCDPSCST